VAPDPVKGPRVAAFPATKLAPLLRAIADPEGRNDLPPEQEDTVRRVEANVAHDLDHR
jgi:hypothetical protein